MPENGKRLTEKQKRFVDYYIITDRNAAEAARRAGYSEKYINNNASKILQNTTIRAAIDAALAELDEKRRLSRKEALEILTSIARGDAKENAVTVEETEGKEKKGKTIRKMQNNTSNRDRLRAVELYSRLSNWEREAVEGQAAKEKDDEQAVRIYLPDNGRGDRDD